MGVWQGAEECNLGECEHMESAGLRPALKDTFLTESMHRTSLDMTIPMYILWYMNTYTILNIKTDKKLKADAQKVAGELGVPLSTVVNAFLKQFVRDKEITFSANQYRPTPYLERILVDAQREYEAGDCSGPMDAQDFISYLKELTETMDTNRASVITNAIKHYHGEETHKAVLKAEQEVSDGKLLRGTSRNTLLP